MTSQGRFEPARELIDLSGRVALVTGGSRGFGFACARRLAEAGAAIVVLARDAGRVRAAARRLEERGATAILPPISRPA